MMKQIRLTIEFYLPEVPGKGEDIKLRYKSLDVSTMGIKGEKEVKLLNNEVEQLDAYIRKRHSH
jgi:hypothetical protein